MDRRFEPARGPLSGSLRMPGDKSLSHRAVLFSAMSEGTSFLSGVLDSADVHSTMAAVSALGAQVQLCISEGGLAGKVIGWGRQGPHEPAGDIDCGNSGTTARLLMGVLAGAPVDVTLVGDASLTRRPMRRITDPLAMMGAQFRTSDEGTLPVLMRGSGSLSPIDYRAPVASAQLKSAILLAGTQAAGVTRVTEPFTSRDHTERLLPAFGVHVTVDAQAHSASLAGPAALSATTVEVPGDPSSAAFVAAAAILVRGSEVSIEGVSLNPTRTGFLDVLLRMGADVLVEESRTQGSEPTGTLTVRHTVELEATTVSAGEVPSLIDEVPVLALLASQATGSTRFEGIGELRVKESDRLAAIEDGLCKLGVTVDTGEDWLEVEGPAELGGAVLESRGDHRLAMCWALAGLGGAGTTVLGYDCVGVSYPAFADDLALLGA